MKILIILGLIVLVFLAGCRYESPYEKITQQDLEKANCQTIRNLYSECGDTYFIDWRLDCRSKILPYFNECK